MDYSVKAQDIPAEQAEMTGIWEIEKKYYHVQPPDNDEYWNKLLADIDAYYKKHATESAKGLGLWLIAKFEKMSRDTR